MKIYVNGELREIENHNILEIKKDNQIAIVDGFSVKDDYILNEYDRVILVDKKSIPKKEELDMLISSRNGEKINKCLQNKVVAICGLGGLGSNIAISLSRVGVKNLLVVDYDIVDITNINRQNYFLQDLGKYKTDAIEYWIKNINPYISVVKINKKLDESNVLDILSGADIIVEAFDDAKAKAMLVNNILTNTDKVVIASSGMAGFYSCNDIKTKKINDRLYIVGDLVSEAKVGEGLMSPRVLVNAGHQANMVLRLLLNITEA